MGKKRRRDGDFIMTLPDEEIEVKSDDDGDSFEFHMPPLPKSRRAARKKKVAAVNDLSFDGLTVDYEDDAAAAAAAAADDAIPAASSIMKKVQARMHERKLTAPDDDDDDDDNDGDDNDVESGAAAAAVEGSGGGEEKSNGNGKHVMERVVATPASLNQMAYFSQMNLSRPLLKAVEKLGFKRPTPVQSLAMPHALNGADVLVSAVTGSGKTAAFMLPILERLLYRSRRVPVTRVLVVTPTRELAAQCQQMAQSLASFTDIRVGLVVGGLSMTAQQTVLRSHPDIIIATPGRLIDHLRNSQSFTLEDIEIMVLDEADRLLDKGFADELREIIKTCPRQRQSMLFSATLSDEVTELVNLSLNHPKRIIIDPKNAMVSTLVQEFVRIRQDKEADREPIVVALCRRTFHERTIVFFRSKSSAHRMMIVFGFLGLKAAELHGNLTQTQRLEALDHFRDGRVNYLLCTDLAARGLDIKGVETVINMDLPRDIRQYIHRVGRTARAGTSGRSVSLAGHSERAMMKEIVQRVQKSDGSEVVRSRAVPAAIVAKYRARITLLNEDVKAVLAEERVEKELRVAEMEANKAQNLYLHQDEIVARPAKTWFQTKKEKEAAKLDSLTVYRAEHHNGGDGSGGTGGGGVDAAAAAAAAAKEMKLKKKKRDPLAGLSRRKKRLKIVKMDMEAEKRERMKMLKQGEVAQNMAFTAEQGADYGVRKKKAELRGGGGGGGGGGDDGDDGDDEDAGVRAPRYESKRRRTEFDQRYGKQVNKVLAKAQAPPKKKKAKSTSKARHRRRKGGK